MEVDNPFGEAALTLYFASYAGHEDGLVGGNFHLGFGAGDGCVQQFLAEYWVNPFGSMISAFSNSEPWLLCMVMAYTVSQSVRRAGWIFLIPPSPLKKHTRKLAAVFLVGEA